MANVLLELGSIRLSGAGPEARIQDALDMVSFIENPVAGMADSLDAFAPAEQRAIAHLRALSAKRRHELLRPAIAQLSGIQIDYAYPVG
jgi:hypothetical protein